MVVVTWTVIDRRNHSPIADAQITVTAEPQHGLPPFRIDLWTDQFGKASVDLLVPGGTSGMLYNYLIAHPTYVPLSDHILAGEPGPINITRSLLPRGEAVPSYLMTFDVSDIDDGRKLNLAVIKSDWDSSFFSVTTGAIGRATVAYGPDKVGDHRVFCKRPNYGRWEGAVSFPAANTLKGIQLSLHHEIIDDVLIEVEKDPPTKEEMDIAWKDLPTEERIATSVLVALSIIYGMRALQGFSAARFKPI